VEALKSILDDDYFKIKAIEAKKAAENLLAWCIASDNNS